MTFRTRQAETAAVVPRALMVALAVMLAPATVAIAATVSTTPAPIMGLQNEVAGEIDLGNARVPFVVAGTGRPCLVLGSHILYRRTVAAALLQNLRCAFVDTRISVEGAPPPADGIYGMTAALEDMERARRQLQLDDFVLMGHSLHGILALEYARRHPGRVSHVVATGTPPSWNASTLRAREKYWENTASPARRAAHAANWAGTTETELAGLTPRQVMVERMRLDAAMAWHDPSRDGRWLWDDVEMNLLMFSALAADLAARDLAMEPRITVPVLLVLGRDDYLVPHTVWDGRREAFTRLTVKLFEYSGHWPQLEEQDLFAAAVVDWLKANGS